MIKLNEIYKCAICGNIVEVVHTGGGELVCCGQPMNLMAENSTDGAKEKHVPVVAIEDGKIKVLVGSAPHPMEDEHYIEWIEIKIDGRVYRKNLQPGDEPSAEFMANASVVEARAYCNLHGLWKK